jgi:hypothetical protein
MQLSQFYIQAVFVMNTCMPYLSPAYKVMFVFVATVTVSPKELEDALFGTDVDT